MAAAGHPSKMRRSQAGSSYVWWRYAIALVALCRVCLANTETFNIYIPGDFPVSTVGAQQDGGIESGLPRMVLHNINYKMQRFDVVPGEMFYVQVDELRQNENYQVRISWTAADGVGVADMGHVVVPHGAAFRGTVDERARVAVHFRVEAEAYPALAAARVPVNVAVVNIKMGIPVDLYSIALYVLAVVGAAAYVVCRWDPYRALKAEVL
ncbi:AFR046Cp [Eremothecium gossypii ATCC 10895]|uniref:AFR046Cp n=1 Tax=Eremothecium gossypii (strain ATCC 10895 / CBS 109.51 / FGSC 9923 / NRRL Y-1056) TaxID=284811 RepID=Q754M6_EREGS|nr:AFR046Cp [Eremothecium gossypii ATCC 10895]AAS53417.1 AFR046Cp [Eremothecium gossypii ATCC 10895]AEY97729.1 FAFR046Cp [Eremothecium gossypii FDAG1]